MMPLITFGTLLFICALTVLIRLLNSNMYDEIDIQQCRNHGMLEKKVLDLHSCPILNGTVLSNDIDRYNYAKGNLQRHNIMVKYHAPIYWKSPDLDKAFATLDVSNNMYRHFVLANTSYPRDRKMASNFMAFYQAIRAFSVDASADDDTWHFFFEDDVNVISHVKNVTCEIMAGRKGPV